MERVVIDTDIFSEILKDKNEAVARKAGSYLERFGFYTTTTITVLEIIKGFHKVGREAKVRTFLSAISSAEILTLDMKSAETAGRIYADLERTGQPIGRADPIIAAIALENGRSLVTGNVEHYKRIQNLGYPLKIVNWKD